MNFITSKNSCAKQKGYTLLFAVLVATLVLGVTVFILSVSRGQYLLASTARESTYAIYVADSGIECGAYAAQALSTSTGGTFICSDMPVAQSIYGLGSVMNPHFVNVAVPGLKNASSVSLTVDLGDGKCAAISFIKGVKATDPTTPVTEIESRGYNYCTTVGVVLGPDITNPKVVERAIRLTYVGM